MSFSYHMETKKFLGTRISITCAIETSPHLSDGERLIKVVVCNDIVISLSKLSKQFMLAPIILHIKPKYLVEISDVKDVYRENGNIVKTLSKEFETSDNLLENILVERK